MNYNERPLRIFIRYIARQKKLFTIDMICALLVAMIDLIFPYVSRSAMRSYLPQKLYTVFFLVTPELFNDFLLVDIAHAAMKPLNRSRRQAQILL